jgi:hypothetical protein
MIYFSNPGVIDLTGLKTFGLTSKAGASDKIGRFGTGLKYAVAVILRKDGVISIQRGNHKHTLRTLPEEFRGTKTQRVVLDDEPLAFTTDLGRDWQPWMAFRELYSNALDEGGNVSDIAPDADRDGTVISVDLPAFTAIHDTMEEHFIGPDEKPHWESDDIRVFRGATDFVFYRGIAVLKLKKRAAFRYDLKGHVSLSEDRTAQYAFIIHHRIAEAMVKCDVPQILGEVVSTRNEFEASLDFSEEDVPPPTSEFIAAAARAGEDCSPTAANLVREALPDNPEVCTVISTASPGGKQLSEAMALLRALGADLSKCKFLLAEGAPMHRDWEIRRGTVFLSEAIFEDQGRMNRAVVEGYDKHAGKHWMTNKLIEFASELAT